MPIHVPALRERAQDIGELVRYFLAEFSARNNFRPRELDPDVVPALERYGWPGNVRELENLIERVLVLSEGPAIVLEDLPAQVRGNNGWSPGSVREAVLGGHKSIGVAVDEFERDLILEALHRTDFNQTRAAERLGTTRRILKYRMDKLGIDAPERNGVPIPQRNGASRLHLDR